MREVLRAAPRIWPLWLVLTGLGVAGGVVTRNVLGPELTATFWEDVTLLAVQAPAWSFAIAFGMRRMLGDPADWRRIDAGLAAYVAIGFVMVMAEEVPRAALQALFRMTIFEPDLLYMASLLAGTVCWLVVLWPTWRLTLWPTGRLVGAPDAGARASWQAMRGVVRSCVLADVALSALPYVANQVAWQQYYVTGGPIALVVAGAVGASWTFLMMGLLAAIYRARVLDAEPLGDIFS